MATTTVVDNQITMSTANKLLNLKRHLRCLISGVAFRQAHLRLNSLSRDCDVARLPAYKAIQGNGNHPDPVTIKTIVEKLKSWQYSSLGSDDLLADLDEMVAEVTRNYIDSDSDSDVFRTFIIARRSDYTAVMSYLKPIQDIITSEHLHDSPGYLRMKLRCQIEDHPLPPHTDMRCRVSWFSDSPDGSVQAMASARENHDKQMMTYAYHNFWARVETAGWKQLQEDLPRKHVKNKSGDSITSPKSGRQTRGQSAASGYQIEKADVPPSKKRAAESRDSKRAPKAAKTARKLDQKDFDHLCGMLKKCEYGSFLDEDIQKVKSRLVVCFRDKARNQFSLMVRNEDGSDGDTHRSVIGLVRQLQAEAIADIGHDRVATTPPRQEGFASGQAPALLSTTPLLVTPAAAAAAAAVPHVSVPVSRVQATSAESPVTAQTAIVLDGPATATVVPTTPGPAVNGLQTPTPAGPNGAGMPTAAASGVMQNFVTKEQVQDAKKILQKYNRQKLAVAQKEKAAIQQKLSEAEAAVATLQAESTNLGSI